ncbi:MAG: IS1634 family transposase, partial [Planctomycetaceae bacterium]|nr:IS1634 family transposase [Planctomycetaceae bacterium]
MTDTQIDIRVGQSVNKYHVAKHFETTIENRLFAFQRNAKSIQYESELDGFYVIRTNVLSDERETSDIVRDYQRLSD